MNPDKSDKEESKQRRKQIKIKVSVRRLLKKYGYPPDKQKLATENIFKQAELLCRDAGFSAA